MTLIRVVSVKQWDLKPDYCGLEEIKEGGQGV